MIEMYGLFFDENCNYKEIAPNENANEVSLSSIKKGEKRMAIMSFNKSGYSTYCKEYTEYWDWVEKRNNERYENTLSHGKNYDAKNMMHTFRLLAMAEEIAREGEVHVERSDRAFLLKVRRGEFEYDYLLQLAEEKIATMKNTYDASGLPEVPDAFQLNELLVQFREALYG